MISHSNFRSINLHTIHTLAFLAYILQATPRETPVFPILSYIFVFYQCIYTLPEHPLIYNTSILMQPKRNLHVNCNCSMYFLPLSNSVKWHHSSANIEPERNHNCIELNLPPPRSVYGSLSTMKLSLAASILFCSFLFLKHVACAATVTTPQQNKKQRSSSTPQPEQKQHQQQQHQPQSDEDETNYVIKLPHYLHRLVPILLTTSLVATAIIRIGLMKMYTPS